MLQLSKTIQLGVIILALQLLGHLKFRLPRIILAVAGRLGLSRKSGYQTAKRIVEILKNPQMAIQPDEDLRREVLRLRIKNQVLAFQLDHPGVRFEERHSHLPPEAKSLCVRLFREFKNQLSGEEIARALGVPHPSLLRWEAEANQDCQFPPKPERRGAHRHASDEDVQRVLEEFKSLKKDLTLEEFTASYNGKYPDQPLDRKTITRILQKHGLRKIETRGGPPPYHQPFKVYFPGAQVSIDATRCGVVFKSDRPKVYTFIKEVGIDIATGAIVGDALGKSENAEGVNRVLIQVREEYKAILSLLSDNGSANRSSDAKGIFQWENEEARIFSFPYHPQTNGHLEGLFGQFVRIVGRIEVDDSSKETLAASIVEVVWRIFIYFHNHSPRKQLGGQSPLEYFRRYLPLPEEVEAARKELRKQGERSRAARQPNPRLNDPRFRSTVDTILKRHRLKVVFDDALRALLPYDLRVIESANNAFFVQSQRGAFDERKRTFAYFMGIVRHKQKELDEERLRSHLNFQSTEKLFAEQRAKMEEIQREKAQEAEDLRNNPERVILKYAQFLLSGGLLILRKKFTEGLRKGLRALNELDRCTRGNLESLADTIRSWGKYKEELKDQMVNLLFAESHQVRA